MDKITLNFFHEKNAEEAYLPKYFVAKNIIMVTREPYWEDPRIIISPLYRGLINKVDQKQVILKEEGWQELKRCRLVQMDNPRFHEFMDSFHENLKKGNFKLGKKLCEQRPIEQEKEIVRILTALFLNRSCNNPYTDKNLGEKFGLEYKIDSKAFILNNIKEIYHWIAGYKETYALANKEIKKLCLERI